MCRIRLIISVLIVGCLSQAFGQHKILSDTPVEYKAADFFHRNTVAAQKYFEENNGIIIQRYGDATAGVKLVLKGARHRHAIP